VAGLRLIEHELVTRRAGDTAQDGRGERKLARFEGMSACQPIVCCFGAPAIPLRCQRHPRRRNYSQLAWTKASRQLVPRSGASEADDAMLPHRSWDRQAPTFPQNPGQLALARAHPARLSLGPAR